MLMLAIMQASYVAAKELLEAGADPLIEDQDGKTALDMANENVDWATKKLRDKSLNSEKRKFYEKLKKDSEEIIKLLESKIPPTTLEQKREQKRQRQAQADHDRLARQVEETRIAEERRRLIQERLDQEKQVQQKREQEREQERLRAEQERQKTKKILISNLQKFTQSLSVLQRVLMLK